MATSTPRGNSRNQQDTVLGGIKVSDIEVIVDERLAATHAELSELRDMVESLRGEVANLPRQMSRQFADALSTVAAVFDDSAQQHDDLIERQRSGGGVASSEADADAQRASQVRQAVDELAASIEERVASLEDDRNRHEAILSPSHDGDRPPSRLDAIEESANALQGQVNALQERVAGSESVIASAFAQARASINGGNVLRRAAVWGLVTFVITLVLYLFAVALTPLEFQLNWALGLPAIVAGIIAAILWLRDIDFEVETLSYAEAQTIVDAEQLRRQEALAAQAPQPAGAPTATAAATARVSS